MKKLEICFPWEVAKKFKGGSVVYQKGTQDLYERGFRLDKLQKEPEEVVIKVTKDIIQRVWKMQEAGETPWLFILSNSLNLITKLSKLVPVTWSLSTRTSSHLISNQMLMDTVFMAKKFDPQDEEEILPADHIKTARFIFWKGTTNAIPGLQKFSGRSIDLLEDREDLPTVFSHVYSKDNFSVRDVKGVYDQVTTSLGEVVSKLINQNASVQNYKLKLKSKDQYEESEF
jgi:hypothetical protein